MGSHTILVVDDESHHLDSLYRTFRRDYQILRANGGGEALDLIRHLPVDLIITDQRMPDMSGLDLLERSLEYCPEAIRFILTAYTDIQDLLQAINSGIVYRYITKPWDPEELKIAVTRALQAHDLRRENQRLLSDLTAKNQSLEETLRKLQEAQSELVRTERLATVGRMAASIIHDLKGPLACVTGYTHLLQREGLTPVQRQEMGDGILKEVQRFADMTQEVLEYSRGNARLSRQPVLVSDLLADLQHVLQQRFSTSDTELEFNCALRGPITVDPGKWGRVLLNLCINGIEALDALPEDRPKRLTVEAKESGGFAVFLVADNANGIPGAISNTLFEPFVTFGKGYGTGLGLAIAKKGVEDHGGEITVESIAGEGTKFIVSLPLERSP